MAEHHVFASISGMEQIRGQVAIRQVTMYSERTAIAKKSRYMRLTTTIVLGRGVESHR